MKADRMENSELVLGRVCVSDSVSLCERGYKWVCVCVCVEESETITLKLS